jgi:hypothetical protein
VRGSRRPADRAALRRGVLRPSSRCAAGIACRLGAGVPPPHWRDWLAAPGSLTARVRRHGARFEVRVLDQGDAAWLPDERAALRRIGRAAPLMRARSRCAWTGCRWCWRAA